MGQGLEVYDVNGNLIIDSSVSLSRLITTITVPSGFSSTMTGTVTDAQFSSGRIYYNVVNGLLPLDRFARALTPYGDRIHVQGLRVTLSVSGNKLTYTVTALYQVTLTEAAYIYIGVY